MERPRALFFGTPDIAVPSLDALVELAEVVFVVCQPDKPVGRHQVLTAPPVKVRATALGLPLEQPVKLRTGEFGAKVKAANADFAVVIAYGRILPSDVLEGPRLGCLNLHASILPKYRGASPIREAIKNGDAETGVTIMEMDAKMDHGPVLKIETLPIDPSDTTPTLTDKLADLGASMIGDALEGVLNGSLKPVEQDHAATTFVKLIKKEDGLIDPAVTDPALVLRLIRANDPWPGTFFMKDGKRVKIISAHIENDALALDVVQPEGKRPMSWADFLRGNR